MTTCPALSIRFLARPSPSTRSRHVGRSPHAYSHSVQLVERLVNATPLYSLNSLFSFNAHFKSSDYRFSSLGHDHAHTTSIAGILHHLLCIQALVFGYSMAIQHVRLEDHRLLRDISDSLRAAKKIVVVTGAGISTSCGIPVCTNSRLSKGWVDSYRTSALQMGFTP